MNTAALKSEMILKGVTNEEMINTIGISKSAYFRRMNGSIDWEREEINKIIKKLNLNADKTMEIFFKIEVS